MTTEVLDSAASTPRASRVSRIINETLVSRKKKSPTGAERTRFSRHSSLNNDAAAVYFSRYLLERPRFAIHAPFS